MMSRRINSLLAISLLAGVVSGAEFVNLTFDEPSLQSLQYYPAFEGHYGEVHDLLRGWTVTEGGIPYTGLMSYSGIEGNGTGVQEYN